MRHAQAELELVREPERAALLMDPGRRRMVEALAERPDSAVGIARRLGDTRQRVNYHLRVLEAAGLIAVVEERPVRGVRERVYRAVARRFMVDPESLGLGERAPEHGGDRFSATWLVAVAARVIRELAGLMERARSTGKRLPTAGVSSEVRLREPGDFDRFVEDLGRAVGDVVSKYHAAEGGGRPFRVVAGVYPRPLDRADTRPEPDAWGKPDAGEEPDTRTEERR